MGTSDPCGAHELPPVDVDVDAALARTRARGARRQRRRAAALTIGAITVVALLIGVALAASRGRDDQVVADGPMATAPPLEGDLASWHIDPDAPPDPEASHFTALVSRIGCNGGVTGEVHDVRARERTGDVVLTFTVEDADPGPHTCPENDQVRHEVQLGAPIGDRLLRDGACAREPRLSSAECLLDDGRMSDVRWPEGIALEPHECDAPEGSPIDLTGENGRIHDGWSDVTDTDLCIVRLDVVAERAGPDHCGRGGARVLIAGVPFGARHGGGAPSVQYIRDPDGLYGDPDLVSGFEADAEIPDGAEPTGYLLDGTRPIWLDPDDPSAVYIWGPDLVVERWPRGVETICN